MFPKGPDNWEPSYKLSDRYRSFTDEWGVEWEMPRNNGLYFDMISHPLAKISQASDVSKFVVPDAANPGRFKGLRESVEMIAASSQAAIIMMPPYGGMFESGFWLRGYKQFFLDLGGNPGLVDAILDLTLQFRLTYWAKALEEVGDLVDVVVEYDDMGTNTSTLISPKMYRKGNQAPSQGIIWFYKKSFTCAHVFTQLRRHLSNNSRFY